MCNQWIYKAPKLDLHCHLDGSLPFNIVRKLAGKRGIILPKSEEELKHLLQVDEDCESLIEYLDKFSLPLKCLQKGEELEETAFELVKMAAEENIIYLEVRFAPFLHMEEGLNVSDVVKYVLAGLKRGKEVFGVYAFAILCGMRHEEQEKNKELISIAKASLNKGVCAIDIAGNEVDFPPKTQESFLRLAIEQGIPITVHAGECGSAENIKESMKIGAMRIGHGIAMKNDIELIKEVKAKKIGVEMCPTSNFQTKAVDKVGDYPFLGFYNAGINISINTDNRTVSDTTVTQEFLWLMKEYTLEQKDIKQLTKNAVNMAFTTKEMKQELLEKIEKFYKQ
jgi:adenosine deaminase